ncbi:cell division protein FtsK [Candidatus Peregrinibacteria bacterium CG11_big_fil_rev_8_21_14_0_20_41_10]|nr:MAG: cell division protein FtsK [Candidatus Peregrinibacteria bacterium CG11_big_fil_rev_8_21_14_0_20_41_10]PIZ76579.1 MAG: cell division protein FtsK [Candidatus Peregrinibacteria bacterium CG_4_10_14_0_2_um_filter_41_8]PJC37665.1 MAG: cell division protein FtsK [Candidatus Peregrinibacteria bacterium CG_4_9_14_0_2_um_filter_41_14]
MARRRKRRRTSGGFLENLFFGPRKTRRRKTKTKQLELNLDEEVKSAIWGIVLITVGALIVLSFFDALGVVSVFMRNALAPILGWGLYFIPILLMFFGVLILFNNKIKINLAKISGVALFFVSILSILHLSIPIEQIGIIAKEGTHGGAIGFATNYLIRAKLQISPVASAVIFVSLFLIAALLTFESSVIKFFGVLFMNRGSKKSAKPKKAAEEKKALPLNQDEDGIRIIKPDIPELKPVMLNEAKVARADEPIEDEVQVRLPIHEMDGVEETLETKVIEWEYPSLELLDDKSSEVSADDKMLRSNAEIIRKKLEQFGIKVVMKNVHVGPTVIQYTLKPSEGVKLSKITGLKNDLALALAAQNVRIEAPIPGKSLVGIEVPSAARSVVYLREIISSPQFAANVNKSDLLCPLGRDVSGIPIVANIQDMPHLLIAGATGAGKSVGMNTILISLLYQNSPSELKLILIDPKRVELTDYNGIPHLLTPVVTDPEKAANALNWAVAEMSRRYETLSHAGCRNIDEYNEDDSRLKKMPKIVIVIDELADLMMANGKEVEASICRIAQMARAVGIHLIVATQRPSVDVITGLIKANIPTRISYAVTSSIDSRTILDAMGAEDLLGKGDMLYLPKDLGKPIRVQGIYISPKEIKRVTDRLKLTIEPDYKDEIVDCKTKASAAGMAGGGGEDDLYDDALSVILDSNKASASLLQRRLRIGYARAARLLDLLEENGVVGPVNGAKPREILISNG